MATQAVSASTLPLSRVAPGAASRTAAPRSLASAASPALCGLRAVTHGAPGSRPCLRRLAPAPRASAEEEAPKTEATPKPAEATPTASPPMDRGQVTAIITGGVSLILAVGYLFLVFLLDSRSGQMLPPPPEAFGP